MNWRGHCCTAPGMGSWNKPHGVHPPPWPSRKGRKYKRRWRWGTEKRKRVLFRKQMYHLGGPTSLCCCMGSVGDAGLFTVFSTALNTWSKNIEWNRPSPSRGTSAFCYPPPSFIPSVCLHVFSSPLRRPREPSLILLNDK